MNRLRKKFEGILAIERHFPAEQKFSLSLSPPVMYYSASLCLYRATLHMCLSKLGGAQKVVL